MKLPIKVLSLDIATKTGYAFRNLSDHHSKIDVGNIKLEGDSEEQKAYAVAPAMIKLIRERRPDFVIFERPMKVIPRFEKVNNDMIGGDGAMTMNAGTTITLNMITGAFLGILGAYNLPWCSVTEGEWRKGFLGFGRKKGWVRKDYKKAAREQCDMLNIVVKNDDQADAVGVIWCVESQSYFKAFRNHYEQRIDAHGTE